MISMCVTLLVLVPIAKVQNEPRLPQIFQRFQDTTGISGEIVYRPQSKDIPLLIGVASYLADEQEKYKGRKEYYQHRSLTEVTLNAIARTGEPGAKALTKLMLSPDTDMLTKLLLTRAIRRFKSNNLDYFKPVLPVIAEVAKYLEKQTEHQVHHDTLLAIQAFINNDLAEMTDLVKRYPHLYIWRNSLELKLKQPASHNRHLPDQRECLHSSHSGSGGRTVDVGG